MKNSWSYSDIQANRRKKFSGRCLIDLINKADKYLEQHTAELEFEIPDLYQDLPEGDFELGDNPHKIVPTIKTHILEQHKSLIENLVTYISAQNIHSAPKVKSVTATKAYCSFLARSFSGLFSSNSQAHLQLAAEKLAIACKLLHELTSAEIEDRDELNSHRQKAIEAVVYSIYMNPKHERVIDEAAKTTAGRLKTSYHFGGKLVKTLGAELSDRDFSTNPYIKEMPAQQKKSNLPTQ
jgi:hypothetical protein